MTSNLDAYRSGSTEPQVTEIVCAIARGMNASVVVETGTYKGLTTLALWEALRGQGRVAQILSIESDPERFQSAADHIAEVTASVLLTEHGTADCAITCSLNDALVALDHLPVGQVDLVFLDDDHDKNHVRAEVCAAFRVLRSGGVLCLHDVCGLFDLGEIVRTMGGVVLPLVRLHASGGLGIMVKP
jgi:predicted O-methyltransferase YrrM